jgi:hypothetical protein
VSSHSSRTSAALDAGELSGGAGSSDLADLDFERSDDHAGSDDADGDVGDEGNDGGDSEDEDGAGLGLGGRRKRQKVLRNRAPIRMQTDGSSRAVHHKGKLLAVSQAIGGLVCHDCGTGWSNRWTTMLLEGENDPVPLCSNCLRYRQQRKQKRPLWYVRESERRRMQTLLFSQHSSWGSLDLIKASNLQVLYVVTLYSNILGH